MARARFHFEQAPMKLYVTPTSPYGRVARIVVAEKGLTDKVEIVIAQTRQSGSPYYSINASGRVPYLLRDNGAGLEDSQLIATYLDNLEGRPRLTPPFALQDYAYGRLESYARSMVDGISVWVREMRRPENERSPTILRHEADRAKRLADHWEREIGHPLMQGPINMAQILGIVGLDFAASSSMGEFEKDRPKLATWARRIRALPSIKATASGSL
jgi:glutathione S-transferase